MDVYECVSFLLVDNGKILLEKRAQNKETDPGLIAIPGGHIEVDETQREALKRELEEELDVTVKSSSYLCSLYHPTEIELQLLHYYLVTDWEGEITALEAESVDWYSIELAPLATDADRLALSEYTRISHYLTD